MKWEAPQALSPATLVVPKYFSSLAFPQRLTLHTTGIIKECFLNVLIF